MGLASSPPRKRGRSPPYAIPRKKQSPLARGLRINLAKILAVAGDSAHFPWKEMIGRPRTGHHHLAVLELLSGRAVAILILFDRLSIDQVSDIEQHAVGVNLLAADFFLQRIKQLMHLDRQRASLSLPFALPRCFLAQFDQVLAPDR